MDSKIPKIQGIIRGFLVRRYLSKLFESVTDEYNQILMEDNAREVIKQFLRNCIIRKRIYNEITEEFILQEREHSLEIIKRFLINVIKKYNENKYSYRHVRRERNMQEINVISMFSEIRIN